MELQPGVTLGNYEIMRLLQSGGFGSVYESRDLRTDHLVALKVLLDDNTSESGIKRFEHEARVLTELEHPNIVRLLEFGRFAYKTPYIAMELLIGRDLRSELARVGHFSVPALLPVIEPLCSALEAVHAHGIIHRDIKASNIFVAEEPRCRRIVLLDFGVAKTMSAEGLTRAGQLVGTLPYLAPEQVRGGRVDQRTDVYGLGMLMFTLLTGRLPYQGKPTDILAYLESLQRPPRVSSLVEVPPALDMLIAKAISMSPADRHGSAAELLHAVRAAISGSEPPSAGQELSWPRQPTAPGIDALGDDDSRIDQTMVEGSLKTIAESGSSTIDARVELLALYESSILGSS